MKFYDFLRFSKQEDDVNVRARPERFHSIDPTGYLSPYLEGRTCPEKAMNGVFAIHRISKGEVLAVWGGDVIKARTLDLLPPDRLRLVLQVEEDLYLVSTREGPADWINHSCRPNAGLSGQNVLLAMRHIIPGEEICFDYAMSDGSSYDEFDCQCGERGCRRRITGNDWRRPELWSRYRGYFSPYLARRIRRLEAGEGGYGRDVPKDGSLCGNEG